MATRTQIFREILREYDALKTHKTAELRQRKEALYERLPRLEEIEQELSLLGTKTAKLVLAFPQNPQQALEEMKQEQEKLATERREIFEKNHLSSRLLEIEYNCHKCQDTGYIEQEQCPCLKRKLMDKLYDQSNVRDIIKVENFDHFDLSLYSDVVSREEEMSPRDNAHRLFRKALDFVKEFGCGANLILYGGTGLGKTYLCNCIAKELLQEGFTVLYLTAGQLFHKLEEQRFHRDDEEEAKEWDLELLEADLLIIDDLGTEFTTLFTATELFRIINDRKLGKKSVVISTNLSPTELIHHYSDRVTSRLMGEYVQMKFFGGDIRIIKKHKQ